MKCAEIRERLSAYHDGEVADTVREQIGDHLRQCDTCARELDQFRRLSQLVAGLPQPAVPPALWPELLRQLESSTERPPAGGVDGSAANEPGRSAVVRELYPSQHDQGADQSADQGASLRPAGNRVRRLSTWQWGVLAASMLLIISASWQAFRRDVSSEHVHAPEVVASFGQYLQRFGQDPDEAQQFLVATYPSTPVTPQQAVQHVGYRPAVATGLPAGYTLAATYVVQMPCCTCVQSVCRREDGSSFAIFEHADGQQTWFGDQPKTTTVCAGKDCCLVNLSERIAASWQRGDRQMTLIGARDRREVDQLVAWLD